VSGLDQYLKEKASAVESALKVFLPVPPAPSRLHESMAYSLFAGGKRVRPVLAIAVAEACGAPQALVMPSACALEMIHTYSLIHDDLPCMDDDDMRRGRPTNHKVFGETVALLAGDALLTLAFKLIADNAKVQGVPAGAAAEVAGIVAEAAGPEGMVGGQAEDCLAEGRKITLAEVESIHRRKTGALIRASVMTGAVLAGASREIRVGMAEYGEKLGLLFQVADDILNIEGDAKTLGKAVGSDAGRGKATFPAVAGLPAARERAESLLRESRKALAVLDGRGNMLDALAEFVLRRKN
jgi:geranylgeranyl diphosphate synthase type II